MAIYPQHTLRVRYRGGLADKNSLPGYDGATSIGGLIRAVHITTHAYMTGEIVSRATALKGASVIIKPMRRGSFIFDIIVMIEAHPATTTLLAALTAAPFYDFVKTAFKRATGALDANPETPHLRALYERREVRHLRKPPADLDSLAETLEGSLQDAHRPIGEAGTIKSISFGSMKKTLIDFDENTKDWVNTQEISNSVETFLGNITRFNSLTKNGRAYVDDLERVIPVRPGDDFKFDKLPLLTWSLHGSNTNAQSKIKMLGRRVTTSSGKTKRILLSDCQK